MTNKHTQGGWVAKQANPSGNNKWLVCEARSYGEGICQLDNEANARLIAASPDMLNALETTQSEIISALNEGIDKHFSEDMLRRWLKGVEEVINKAKGN